MSGTPFISPVRRALTLPLPTPAQLSKIKVSRNLGDHRTDPQNGAPILSLLPFELRQSIWKHVISGWGRSPIVHICEMNARLTHWRCQTQPGDFPCEGTHLAGQRNESCRRQCLTFKGEYEYRWREEWDGWAMAGAGNLIPILQSCRRIYTDMIPLLYSETTFLFINPSIASSFAHSILPQRLNAIRALSIDWVIQKVRLPASDKEWKDVWDTVAQMQSIGEVRLLVQAQEAPHWHYEFQWKWKHEGVAERIENGELKVDFWNNGTRIPAIFGEDERRNLPSTYNPPQQWGKEWYEM